MVDLQETPAVPPEPTGGDDRLGTFIAGSLLLFLGWAVAVGGNLALHAYAGTAGMKLGWIWITSTLGTYAWAVVGFGIVTGFVGLGLLLLGRTLPRGPFVLPGVDY